MTIRASAFATAKAIDLPHGSLFTIEHVWYLRAQLVGTIEPEIQVGIPLAGSDQVLHLSGDRCITLAPEHAFECRIIGPIEGPGLPLPGALTCWNSYWRNCGHRTPLANPKTPSLPVQCR